MPIPAAEFDAVEDPAAVIRDFLKRNSKEAWAPEEISERTGIDMTATYHICQLLRSKHIEAAANGEYFPVRSIDRLGQTYFKWVPKKRKAKDSQED